MFSLCYFLSIFLGFFLSRSVLGFDLNMWAELSWSLAIWGYFRCALAASKIHVVEGGADYCDSKGTSWDDRLAKDVPLKYHDESQCIVASTPAGVHFKSR